MQQHLDIIYQYYPKDVPVWDPKYIYTEEITRHFKMARQASVNNAQFVKLNEGVSKEFNVLVPVFSLRGVFDFCYTSVLPIPNSWGIKNYTRCAYSISILAKYYCVYLTQSYDAGVNTLKINTLSEQESSLIDEVSKIIKKHYPEYELIPEEALYEVVPGVYSNQRLSEFATFFECLITDSVI